MIETKEQYRVSEEQILKNILAATAADYPDDPKELLNHTAASRLRRWYDGTWHRKSCIRCRAFEPVAEFGSHHRAKDGKQAFCKNCCVEVGWLSGGKRELIKKATYSEYDGG